MHLEHQQIRINFTESDIWNYGYILNNPEEHQSNITFHYIANEALHSPKVHNAQLRL